MPSAVIEADGLARSFGGRPALTDVSFTVDAGEVVGLLGPNGAGKTTVLRILLGLLPADRGGGSVHGEVGYLPEGHTGYDALTVGGYLRFLARAKGVPRAVVSDETRRVLDAVDAADLVRRPVGRLSKGQRQRVGIAQALLGSPPAYVLDEPTSGLDPAQVAGLRTLVRNLAGTGSAVLISTHLLAEAAASCDRIVVVAKGRVVATETPGDAADLEARFLRLVAEAELS